MMNPISIPQIHEKFLNEAVHALSCTPSVVGVAIGGSYLSGTMDEFSDLDLIIAIEPDEYDRVMEQRQAIAASLGHLVGSFTGEHVGEPRLLICLYDAPLLHVDLKFVEANDLGQGVEDPKVLWEREDIVSNTIQAGVAHYPVPDPQWIEDRFWIWVHYGASKIGRGELFEAIDFLAFLRSQVLGPLALHQAGYRATGVRKIEALLPEFSRQLESTLSTYSARDCCRALTACVEIYRDLRGSLPLSRLGAEAERAATAYLAEIQKSKS